MSPDMKFFQMSREVIKFLSLSIPGLVSNAGDKTINS